MKRELLSNDLLKAIAENSISFETLKLNADISAVVLQNIFNMLVTGYFLDNTKLSETTFVYK